MGPRETVNADLIDISKKDIGPRNLQTHLLSTSNWRSLEEVRGTTRGVYL